ncbi:type I-G CRISPR-associated protein Csb2 [Gordonia sp. (in: high G+C Gram-positive bacteria)]|uniref:type I-G CRISPR-associated protein Csb2 n=1 Tax=Gordonia sp. (in: high G+C Gram-positive bacteria) TaxID=84139 RepID=UPI003C77930E
MSVKGIRARFPLGVYRGHAGAGQYDPLPSPLRLHAALVAAAGDGSTAVVEAGALRRSESATRALEWLEDNPPEYVALPEVAENGLGALKAFAYRDEGVVENVKTAPSRRKTARIVVDSTALRGALGWGWKQLPDDVATTLDDLCADVPCLGEADSPVVLEFGSIEPTHKRSASRSPFASVAIRLQVARQGRLGELDALYRIAQPGKSPTTASDRWAATEKVSPPPISHDEALTLGYDRIDEPESPVAGPWAHVILFPINREIPMEQRVAWSVAMHRALVAALDNDATPMVTGRYDKSAVPPANRIGIQVLSNEMIAMTTRAGIGGGIALLVPEGAMETILPVLPLIRRLYRGNAGALDLGRPVQLSAMGFWKEPDVGTVRTWAAVPAVVPETRRQKKAGSRRWTLADSALLSVGFVFRDRLGVRPEGTAGERYAAIIDAVGSFGVRILNTSLIPDADIGKYAHKVPQGVVAQPYRLALTSGSLIGDRMLVAVGQSRHLGGGLLVPVDLPAAVAQAWGVPE